MFSRILIYIYIHKNTLYIYKFIYIYYMNMFVVHAVFVWYLDVPCEYIYIYIYLYPIHIYKYICTWMSTHGMIYNYVYIHMSIFAFITYKYMKISIWIYAYNIYIYMYIKRVCAPILGTSECPNVVCFFGWLESVKTRISDSWTPNLISMLMGGPWIWGAKRLQQKWMVLSF